MKTTLRKTTVNSFGFWIKLDGISVGLIVLLAAALPGHAGTFEGNIEKTFNVRPGGKLELDADRGSVEVSTKDSPEVQVRVLRKVEGASKSAADDLFAEHEVRFKQDGDTVSVTAKSKRNNGWINFGRSSDFRVRYEISVPKKFNLDLRTAGGGIKVEDLDGDLAARTTSGTIDLGRTTGRIEATDAGGNVKIQAGGAEVVARTTSGSIQIGKAGGSVEAQDAGGNIKIDEAGTSVNARTTSGSIVIGKAGGDATAKDAGGNITIHSALGIVNANTTSGSIKVGSAGKTLSLQNAGGGIDVETAHGPVNARTTSGNIRIGTAMAEAELKNAGGSIEITDARGAVTAETTSGQIAVNFTTTPKGASRLQVAGGGIRAGLPADAGVTLDARSSGGNVNSDWPVAVTTSESQPHGALQGKINGGGPSLYLRSSSGNIRVIKSTRAAETTTELEESPK